MEPRYVGSRINLMSMYLGTGMCAQAAEAYEGALEAFSGKPDDLYWLVPVLSRFGLREAAAETIREMNRLNEEKAERALFAFSRETVIDTTCSRAGWPPVP